MLISGAKNNAAISLEAATTVAAPDAAKMAVDWSLIFQVGLKDVVCESAIRSKKIALCNCTLAFELLIISPPMMHLSGDVCIPTSGRNGEIDWDHA